jgi:Flp pilus assembly protein TadG
MNHKNESGVAALELALLLPVILALLFGIVEFGRAYNASITLTHAARESVRKLALRDTVDHAKDAGDEAAASLVGDPTYSAIITCAAGVMNAKITMDYDFDYDIPFFKIGTINMSKTATMLCGG